MNRAKGRCSASRKAFCSTVDPTATGRNPSSMLRSRRVDRLSCSREKLWKIAGLLLPDAISSLKSSVVQILEEEGSLSPGRFKNSQD